MEQDRIHAQYAKLEIELSMNFNKSDENSALLKLTG
jgi:hypothetical protein